MGSLQMVSSFVWSLVLKRRKSFTQSEFQGRQEGAVHTLTCRLAFVSILGCSHFISNVHKVLWLFPSRRQKKTASHVMMELESTKDCSQAGKPFFCPSHPSEELGLFCEQCDQPVCQDCVAERHRQHPYDFTSNAVHRHGDSLRELLRSTQQRMSALEDVLGQTDGVGSAIRARAEAVATEICLFARGYVKAIEEHRDRLLKQLEDLKVQKENLLHLQKAQLQQLLLDMRTGVEFTERLLTSGSDLGILVTKGVVASRLAKLNSAAYSTHPSVDDSIQFSPQERAGQCHGYEVFGAVICKAVDPAKCTLQGEGNGVPYHFLLPEVTSPFSPPGWCAA